MKADVSAIHRWLVDEPNDPGNHGGFARALAERLTQAGLPIWRVSFALLTMHPEVLWRTVQWKRDAELVVHDQPHARLEDAFYKQSAVAVVRASKKSVRVRLSNGDLAFPICSELRAAGGTDYLVYPLEFTNGAVSYISFASDGVGGFSDADIALLDELRPFVARRIELDSSYYATRALLDVYLGKNAARRVFAGEFQRGHGELIDAAIWFSDMRDFTALSDRSSPAAVIETLDAYFDAVATSIAEHDGEVLKFIGDAVLGIFPLGNDARSACRNALAAADQAFASLALANESRAKRGAHPMAIGVALHCGNVMYGNVGAHDRLDFTVISSAVNEASRLESLTKQLKTSFAFSKIFAETAAVEDAVDLGEHALKGVKAPLHVFTRRAHVTG